MGKAIVISGIDWSQMNLGQVTPLLGLAIEGASTISGASVYRATYDGNPVSVSWSVSGEATISASSGTSVTLTPLEDGAITLTASYTKSGTQYTATKNIGAVLPHLEILPSVSVIESTTTFTAYYGEEIATDAVFSVSSTSLARLVDAGNGTCTVEPLVEDNATRLTLTATSPTKGTATASFIPRVPTMPSGYTRMAYVQSQNYVTLDTGYTPSSNTRIVADYQYLHTALNTSYAYLCDDKGKHNIAINGVNAAVIYNGLTTALSHKHDFARHTADFNQSRLIYDGVEYPNTTENPEAWTSTATLTLFGGINSSVSRSSPTRIYRFRIYDADTMVRDYIPAQRDSDGKYGLYEAVGGSFLCKEDETDGHPLYGVATIPDYVSEGLVVMLDGYDANNSYWADTATGAFGLALRSGVTKTADGMGVVFDQNGTAPSNPSAYLASTYEFNAGSATIEVVYKADAVYSEHSQLLFKGYCAKSGSHGTFGFYIDNVGNVRNDLYTVREKNNSIEPYLGSTVTQSLTTALNYVNGVSLGKSEVATSAVSPGGTSTPMVAGSYSSSTLYYGFTGTIYQIRVYNRELTAEEILHNQAIDIQRYGINNQ